jgi:hypothetical protein
MPWKPGHVDIVARPSIGEDNNGKVVRVSIEIEGTGGADGDGEVSIRW